MKAEDVGTWGATKRRTTQPKPREAGGISESQVEVAVATNSNVITYQAGNPARLKAHARSKVVKKEKEQTLTATLTERSEVKLTVCGPFFTSTTRSFVICAPDL